MIFSLYPLFVTQVFGLATLHLGILEGIIEFVSWATRILSGVISDYLRKRKPVLLVAYLMTCISRPFFPLAGTVVWAYVGKVLDRIANGLQASPREALIGDVTPKDRKGAAYGLRQSMGVLGSLIGAIVVIGLMRYSDNDYSFVFWVASVPPVLALLGVYFFIEEPPFLSNPEKEAKAKQKLTLLQQLKEIRQLDFVFWSLLLVGGIFMLSNYNGVYRLLVAEKSGFATSDVSLIMVIQNLGIMLAAFPIGRLSDKLDRRALLACGMLLAIASNLCFILLDGVTGIVAGTLLWGLQMGSTQSILLSMVAHSAPKHLRGSAFGIYYLVVAFALCIANIMTGYFFHYYGYHAAFQLSAILATVSLLMIPLIKVKK
jgi:MFS family permease